MNSKTVGVIVVLLASIMWAIEPVIVKLSFQSTDFLQTFATRSVFGLLTITIYVFVVARQSIMVGRKHLPALVYVSLAATLFADLMYIYALTRVPVINAVLIGHMQPIFIVLLGFCFLKEDRVNAFDYLGIACMILAGLLVTGKNPSNLLHLRIGTLGDLYVLLATVAWATTAIVARRYLKELHAGIIAFYRFFFATVVFVVYMMAKGGIGIANIYQVILGVVIGIGTILYYEGIRLIKAAQVSALELSTPFFATILAYVILKEHITTTQLIGILFLFGGIYFLSRKETL